MTLCPSEAAPMILSPDSAIAERLRKLEALAARPGTPGEGAAARAAIERIRGRCAPARPAFDFAHAQQRRRPAARDVLLGMHLRLDRSCDRKNGCCQRMGVIRPGKGPHAYALHCADCDRQRGWLKHSTANLLRAMASDGRLKSPILRDAGVVP
jgi:hypothetical protein